MKASYHRFDRWNFISAVFIKQAVFLTQYDESFVNGISVGASRVRISQQCLWPMCRRVPEDLCLMKSDSWRQASRTDGTLLWPTESPQMSHSDLWPLQEVLWAKFSWCCKPQALVLGGGVESALAKQVWRGHVFVLAVCEGKWSLWISMILSFFFWSLLEVETSKESIGERQCCAWMLCSFIFWANMNWACYCELVHSGV